MNDYTWPSVYFAYFFFAICLVLAVFFFIRSLKDGYWSKESEAIRYQVFDDAPLPLPDGRGSVPVTAQRPMPLTEPRPLGSGVAEELTHAR